MEHKTELLDEFAQLLFDEVLFDAHIDDDATLRRLEIIKSYLRKYADEVLEAKGTDDCINDLIKSSWHEETFRIFWQKYNKKVQYAPAFKKWMKLKKADVEKILETVDAFVIATPDPKFRPNPLTYLNQRRWEDQLPDAPQIRKQIPTTKENTWDGY